MGENRESINQQQPFVPKCFSLPFIDTIPQKYICTFLANDNSMSILLGMPNKQKIDATFKLFLPLGRHFVVKHAIVLELAQTKFYIALIIKNITQSRKIITKDSIWYAFEYCMMQDGCVLMNSISEFICHSHDASEHLSIWPPSDTNFCLEINFFFIVSVQIDFHTKTYVSLLNKIIAHKVK